MKKLNEYINNQYISLSNIDEQYIDKVKNLQGMQITECCCNSCCDCGCETCGEPCCVGSNQIVFFNSEDEIINRLKSNPTVQDIFNIHNQFGNRFEFMDDDTLANDVYRPLYFRSMVNRCTAANDNPIPANTIINTSTSSNRTLYNFINSLLKTHKFTYPTIATFDNGEVQIYMIKGEGQEDNKKYPSIKFGLTDVAKTLDKLEKTKGITWAQVLNVSIDNKYDVYNFLVTFTIDMTQFPVEIKTVI